jgi:hypothetical protein
MTAWTFVYRCRLCGEKFNGLTGGMPVCEAILMQLTCNPHKPATEKFGPPVSIIEVHNNCDGGIGLGDLLGARAKPPVRPDGGG